MSPAEDTSHRPPLATAAFVASLAACVPGAGIVAVVLGLMALRRSPKGRAVARSLAGFAISVGALSTLAWVGGGVYLAHQVLTVRALRASKALYEVDVRTGAKRLVYDAPGADACPTYAPDGHTLYFQHAAGHMVIESVPLAGGKAHVVVDLPGDATAPAISPDGKTVAFRYRDPVGDWSVGLVPVAGGKPRFLLADAYQDLSGPRFSPDGTRIVVAGQPRGALGPSRSLIVPLSGEMPKVVTHPRSGPRRIHEMDPDWWDGQIAMVRGESVALVDVAKGSMRLVYTGLVARSVRLRKDALFFASNTGPDGKAGGAGTPYLVRGDTSGAPPAPITSSKLTVLCFDLSPDGTHLAVGLPRTR